MTKGVTHELLNELNCRIIEAEDSLMKYLESNDKNVLFVRWHGYRRLIELLSLSLNDQFAIYLDDNEENTKEVDSLISVISGLWGFNDEDYYPMLYRYQEFVSKTFLFHTNVVRRAVAEFISFHGGSQDYLVKSIKARWKEFDDMTSLEQLIIGRDMIDMMVIYHKSYQKGGENER